MSSSCMFNVCNRVRAGAMHHGSRASAALVDSSTDYRDANDNLQSASEQPWSRRLPHHVAVAAVSNSDIFDGRFAIMPTTSAAAATASDHHIGNPTSSLTCPQAVPVFPPSYKQPAGGSNGCRTRLGKPTTTGVAAPSSGSRRPSPRNGSNSLSSTGARSTSNGSSGRADTVSRRSSGGSLPGAPGPASQRVRPAYKHVPHRDKPPHLVARRNARERRRVQAVNGAFVRLRRHLPVTSVGKNKRLSKVKTLRIAIDYISHLQRMIADDERISSAVGYRTHQTSQQQEQQNSQRISPAEDVCRTDFDDEYDDENDDDDDDDDDDISTTTSHSAPVWSRAR